MLQINIVLLSCDVKYTLWIMNQLLGITAESVEAAFHFQFTKAMAKKFTSYYQKILFFILVCFFSN